VSLPSGLEIGLVASITGMTAVSLFTLYLQDRLMNRVEHLERSTKPEQKLEVKEIIPETSKVEPAAQATPVEAKVEQEAKPSVSLEDVFMELAQRNQKMTELGIEIRVANKKLDDFEKNIALNDMRLNVFEDELSKLVKRLGETEDTVNAIKNPVHVNA
jgi:chromosome segregation ATPase